MPALRLLRENPDARSARSDLVEVPRAASATRGRFRALGCMDNHDNTPSPARPANTDTATPLRQVVTLSELCTHLHVPIQTLYDLRSQAAARAASASVASSASGRVRSRLAGQPGSGGRATSSPRCRGWVTGWAVMGRPRTDIGTYGVITTRRMGEKTIAETRVRDADGKVRQARVCRDTAPQARRDLKKPVFLRVSMILLWTA